MKKFCIIQNHDYLVHRECIIRCLFFIMALFTVNLNIFAFEVGGIKYNIENSETKEVSVVGLASSNNSSNISIPGSVEYSDVIFTVTSISARAFKDCTQITSMEISDVVKSIGKYAFQGCSRLTSITMPRNLTSIPEGLFDNCSGISNISIPNSVT